VSNRLCPNPKCAKLFVEGNTCPRCGATYYEPGAPTKLPLSAEQQHRKERITAITMQIIASQINKGQLNPDDEDALRAATRQACKDAATAYDAATDFLFK